VRRYTILENVNCSKLISVPLRLWFSPAYRSKTDMWDRHYHDSKIGNWTGFEKTGWEIVASEKFTHPVKIDSDLYYGFFTPRYYIVYAEN
jgi:hypothetical protein